MSGNARAVDVTFVARTAAATVGFQLALAVLAHHRRRRAIDVAKLRVAAGAGGSHALQAELLAAARQRFASPGPPLVTMWIASSLEDVSAVRGNEADAFFFRWNLSESPVAPDADVSRLEKIEAFVGAGRIVLLQLAIKTAADVRRHAAALAWAAERHRLVSAQCRWELALLDPAVLFFAPSPCRRDDRLALKTVGRARQWLAAIGITAHGNVSTERLCPAEQPHTYLFDDAGPRPWCARARQLASDRHQVDASCAACASRAVCAARCPAIAEYGQPSLSCGAWRKEVEAPWHR